MRGFVLGNPKGFNTKSAMKFGEVSVTIDPSTITSDVIVIKEVRITEPEVTYELGSGGSNFDAIKRNVDAYVGGGGKTPPKKGEKKEAGKKGPKLVIENLYITGGKVGVSATFLKGKSVGGTLPDIHLKDIGKEKKTEPGATPGEVAKKVHPAHPPPSQKTGANCEFGQCRDRHRHQLSRHSRYVPELVNSYHSGFLP